MSLKWTDLEWKEFAYVRVFVDHPIQLADLSLCRCRRSFSDSGGRARNNYHLSTQRSHEAPLRKSVTKGSELGQGIGIIFIPAAAAAGGVSTSRSLGS
jgi:hypothetical protein